MNRVGWIAGALVAVGLGVGVKHWIDRSVDTLPARDQVVLMSRQNSPTQLKSLHGKPTLIHFWATWCAPCVEELPQFLNLAAEFQPKGLQVVAVSLDKTWEDADKLLPASKLVPGMLSFLDPELKAANALGSFEFPESYLLNASGEVAHKLVGQQPWLEPKFRSELELWLRAQLTPSSR